MADNDILIGPGRIYYAPLGETDPSENTVAFGAAWGGDWVNLGEFIEGQPVTLSMPEDFVKVYTEQATAPKNAVRTRREFMIKVTLAEHSSVAMALALQAIATPTAAGAAQKGVTNIPFGVSPEIIFRKWGIEARRKDAAGVDQPVRWFLHKGYVRLSGDTAYGKMAATGIPIEITILGDSTQSAGGELGKLQIVTAPFTP